MIDDQQRTEFDVPPAPELSAPKWADTSTAETEEKYWGNLDEVRTRNDRNWLAVYGWLVIAVSVVFTGIFLISLVIWALHHMLPSKCLWLSDVQLSKIQSVLFSGGMGAVVSSIVKRQLDRVKS